MRPNWLSLNPTRGNALRVGRWSTRVRRSLFGALASILALVGLVAFATPSFAHNNVVVSSGACSASGSNYVVTWTIYNDFPLPETGNVTSVTNNGTPVVPTGLNTETYSIAGTNPARPMNQWSHATLTQRLPVGTTQGTLTLNITSTWQGGFSISDAGTFDLSTLSCGTPPAQTLAGHIYLCQDGNPTTTEESGGTVGATGAQTVPVQGNPLNPINVAAGGYTMTATAPPNFTLVTCGGTSTPSSDGSSATEPVTVPSGGAGVGIFYVTAVSVSPATTTTTTQPVTSPSQTTPGGGSTTPATTAPTTSPSAASATTPASLAFTGAPVGKEWIFGLGALILGSGLILTSRLRLRRPKHAASKQN
jgi:hypothetical protein